MTKELVTSLFLYLVIACLGCGSVLATDAALDCGSLSNAYGPYDYTNHDDYTNKLPIVEQYHFDSAVESLSAGKTDFAVMGDLDYTLRAFPNHHRALSAMANYRLQNPNVIDKYYSAECYFQRAIRFRPTDNEVKTIYAVYLHRSKNYRLAEEYYQKVLDVSPDSSEVHYNLGLLYYSMQKYDLAVQHARQAYALDYPLQGLKNLLVKKGVWN
jgi:tetratricopeptide (TPR) repeat protein